MEKPGPAPLISPSATVARAALDLTHVTAEHRCTKCCARGHICISRVIYKVFFILALYFFLCGSAKDFVTYVAGKVLYK